MYKGVWGDAPLQQYTLESGGFWAVRQALPTESQKCVGKCIWEGEALQAIHQNNVPKGEPPQAHYEGGHARCSNCHETAIGDRTYIYTTCIYAYVENP